MQKFLQSTPIPGFNITCQIISDAINAARDKHRQLDLCPLPRKHFSKFWTSHQPLWEGAQPNAGRHRVVDGIWRWDELISCRHLPSIGNEEAELSGGAIFQQSGIQRVGLDRAPIEECMLSTKTFNVDHLNTRSKTFSKTSPWTRNTVQDPNIIGSIDI